MIKRELAMFLVVGVMTVLIDFFSYRTLIGLDIFQINIAKAIGFLIGTIFAYFANRFWTFGYRTHLPGSALRFSVLYIGTLVVNVLVNSLVLNYFDNVSELIQFAFLVATVASASFNFLGMKFFVFKARSSLELE